MELEINIEGLAVRYGEDRLGFLTFTFADDVCEIREASRRFNSLATHALRGRYVTHLAIVERTRKKRVHLHLVVVCREDIRTGFNFEAVKNRDYRSASPYLRSEWAFWREASPRYGFGRSELLPIRTSAWRFGAYLAKYLVKQFGTRRREDRGSRLVRYGQNFPRTVHGDFSPLWRGQRINGRVKWLETHWNCSLRLVWGPNWRWHLGRLLLCSDIEHDLVVARTDRILETQQGLPFAVSEAFDDSDRLRRSLTAHEG